MPRLTEKSATTNLAQTPACEAAGIIDLIQSARCVIQHHFGDHFCTQRLQLCLDRLCAKYEITPSGRVARYSPAKLPSLIAVIRLLAYAQADVVNVLEDVECARLLKECVDELSRTLSIPAGEEFGCAACTAH